MSDRNYWQRRVPRRTILRGAALGLVGLAGAALVGCSGGDDDDGTAGGKGGPSNGVGLPVAQDVKRGGTLIIAAGGEPTELDPVRGRGGGDHKYFWTMFEGLAQYNREGLPDPKLSLAQSWEIIDPTTINFTLRPGVKFHDGTPFNAEAVKFNIERVKNPDTKSAARAQILPVSRVEVVDDLHVVFHLDRPNASLITLLGDRGGQMVSPTAVTRMGNEAHDKAPVGTGPFKFANWTEEQVVRVQRNPDYWRKGVDDKALPYLDTVEWRVVPEPNVQLANLESGEAHIIDAGSVVSELDRLEKDPRYQVTSFVGTSWSGSYFNLVLPPTNDVNLRRAVSYAIDREGENKAIFLGRNVVVKEGMGIITPALKWAYAPVPNAPQFDLQKARDYLAASRFPSGTTFNAVIGTTAESNARGALWQDMLKKIGITLDLKPSRTLTDDMWLTQNRNMCIAGFSIRADPDGTVGEVVHTEGFYNGGHYSNPPLDELIAKARESYDPAVRAQRYKEIEQVLAKEIYDVYSVYTVGYRVTTKAVQNVASIWGAEGKDRYAELSLKV